MNIEQLIAFFGKLEKLKCNTRHSWTSSGRQESVAEHSFMLAMMAWLVKDAFPEVDIHKVILMCLIHDFGEAVTGDIPAFLKNNEDEDKEEQALRALLDQLPDKQEGELTELFAEMRQMKTAEAKLYKALDKMEAVMQHNEAAISTWLPLEYDLQLSYGEEETSYAPYLRKLKKCLNENTIEKIEKEKTISSHIDAEDK